MSSKKELAALVVSVSWGLSWLSVFVICAIGRRYNANGVTVAWVAWSSSWVFNIGGLLIAKLILRNQD